MSEINKAIETSNSIDDKIQMILRQTNYTESEAKEKLIVFKEDYILVIKDFLGIKDKDKREKPICSVNQEIYKQLRYKLSTTINATIQK